MINQRSGKMRKEMEKIIKSNQYNKKNNDIQTIKSLLTPTPISHKRSSSPFMTTDISILCEQSSKLFKQLQQRQKQQQQQCYSYRSISTKPQKKKSTSPFILNYSPKPDQIIIDGQQIKNQEYKVQNKQINQDPSQIQEEQQFQSIRQIIDQISPKFQQDSSQNNNMKLNRQKAFASLPTQIPISQQDDQKNNVVNINQVIKQQQEQVGRQQNISNPQIKLLQDEIQTLYLNDRDILKNLIQNCHKRMLLQKQLDQLVGFKDELLNPEEQINDNWYTIEQLFQPVLRKSDYNDRQSWSKNDIYQLKDVVERNVFDQNCQDGSNQI